MKKLFWIGSLLSAAVITASAGAAMLKFSDVEMITPQAEENWQVEEIKDAYAYGTYFDVPSALVNVGGTTTKAEATVVYPDGTMTLLERVPLNQAGVYTVAYRAVVNDFHCVEEKKFTVSNKSYLVQSEKSSVSYGAYTSFGANSEGLLVNLAEGDSLTFTQPIDVSSLTGLEKLFEAFITPNARGSYDFNKLIVTLTDVEDSSVYLRFQLKRYPSEVKGINKAYVTAGGNGQSLVGYENGYSSINTKKHGTPITLTFSATMFENDAWSGTTGTTVDRAPDAGKWSVSYNSSTTEATTTGGAHIAYLNDSEVFEESWAGFISGKARMTITAEEYTSDTANFCITQILGVDLEETVFLETEAPIIDVSLSSELMPYAQVDSSYTIPTATAFDYISGDCDVNIEVYRDYATKQPIKIGVIGNTFTPTVSGWYTIVYKAQDALENAGIEIRNVYAADDLGEIVVQLPENREENATLGRWVSVEPATYSGDAGLSTQKITVSHNGETFEITDGFLPESAGEWTVRYEVTDYIGRTGSAEYSVQAEIGEGYVVLDQLVLPQIFLSGCEYVLPEIYAVDYSSGSAVRKLCNVTVMDTNGEKTYNAGTSFIPSVAQNGDEVQITYHCEGETLLSVEVPTVLVKSGSMINGMNYLYGDGFDVSYKDLGGAWLESGLSVIASEASERCGWTFATPQIAEGFELVFKGEKARAKFDALTLTLTDAYDPEKQISLTISAQDKIVTLTSGANTISSSNATLVTDDKYTISYTNGVFKFNGIPVLVDVMTNGEVFNGFTSSFVYAKVEMLNAEKNAGYILREVCGAGLSRENLDVFKPNILLHSAFGGNQSINKTVEISTARANDVFAPSVEISLTVTAPDGSIVVDNNGVRLENVSTEQSYFITLTNYGQYKAMYTVEEKDWVATNKRVYTESIFVIDEIAPQVKFVKATQTQAKVGDVLILPDVTVKDNLTATEDICIVAGVYNPLGKYYYFVDGQNAIKCAYEGEYIFHVMVYDERGNMTTITHTVNVTEK